MSTIIDRIQAVFAQEYYSLGDAFYNTDVAEEERTQITKVAEALNAKFQKVVREYKTFNPFAPYAIAEEFAFGTLDVWERNLLRAWHAQQIPF